MTSSNSYSGRYDELTCGVKVTQTIDLCICAKTWFWMFDGVVRVASVIVLDDKVEQLLVARVRVRGRIARVDTNLAALVKRT